MAVPLTAGGFTCGCAVILILAESGLMLTAICYFPLFVEYYVMGLEGE
jgi:hypothetical protein